MTTPLPIAIEVPRAALCPRYSRSRPSGGHEAAPVKRRSNTPGQWRCKYCKQTLRWDQQYYCYVSNYRISEEEEPW